MVINFILISFLDYFWNLKLRPESLGQMEKDLEIMDLSKEPEQKIRLLVVFRLQTAFNHKG